ncbi:hypothetical protein GM418_01440 [Maribellus comscasis]|uniref:Uncharacterized protein n=1 Tax=Maribellus comscasis TaxID=2681766 RepID=A0A6I6JXD1_9BACT|nr:DUF6057 family protein [Maribellus comscasis]QGY42364.1 hypothetical protein GM418_01440 [Maribellus comscasis]
MNRKNQKSKLFLLYFPYLLFFISGVFYLSWFTSYIFFYQEKAVLFQTTYSFFIEKVSQPGGFLEYLGEIQTAFYYYPLLGAVLIVAEIVTVIFIIAAIGRRISGNRTFVLPFLVGGILFFLQTHYQYRSLNTIGVLIQLLFFYTTVKAFKKKAEWIPVLLFPLNYFLFGSFSYLFLVLFILWQIQNRGKYWYYKIPGIITAGVLFYYIGKEFLFFQTVDDLIVFPYAAAKIGKQVQMFLSLVFLVSVLPFLFQIKPKIIENIRRKRFPFLQLVPFVLILALTILSVGRIDKKNSHYFYVEKLFYQQKYDEIIAFNSEFPSNNILTNYLNNVALAETGRLDDMFFSFPQSVDGATLFLKWDLVTEVLKRGGYFYYTLGMINEAQRWAYEFMVMHGLTPEGLKMLIKTELINGNYKVAQKYISILGNTIFYRDQANEFETFLFNDEAVNKQVELGKKRASKVQQDFFVLSDDPAANLDFIIEADSTNYTALEYKLAWLMLQKDMAQVVKQLPILEKCGIRKMPKNVEEAVVAYQQLNVGEMPELERLTLNRETVQRFRQYYQIFQQNSSNREQAKRALSQNFSDTFWFYVFFS